MIESHWKAGTGAPKILRFFFFSPAGTGSGSGEADLRFELASTESLSAALDTLALSFGATGSGSLSASVTGSGYAA
jgi:hypothetical protein